MNIQKNETQVELGHINEVPPGQGRCFIVNEKEIAVFHTRSGQFYAIENRCPHKKGPLAEGICDSNKVICPYHAHAFEFNTGKGGEPGENVKIFKVIEREQRIILHVT